MAAATREFGQHMRRYERSRTPGTPEHAKWRDYPGDALRDHTCSRYDCVAYGAKTDHQTWFLCPECAKLAPDAIASFMHVPYKVQPTAQKRKQASAVCFAVYLMARRRKRGITSDGDAQRE